MKVLGLIGRLLILPFSLLGLFYLLIRYLLGGKPHD